MKDKQAPQKIDKIYASWKASGLTQVEYCKREGLSFTWFKNQAYKKRAK